MTKSISPWRRRGEKSIEDYLRMNFIQGHRPQIAQTINPTHLGQIKVIAQTAYFVLFTELGLKEGGSVLRFSHIEMRFILFR